MSTTINVRELADEASVKPVHLLVLVICFLTAVVDGLDNQAIGFTAPAIAADLGISLASFGYVFSSGLIGTLVGAVILGRLADRIGRRNSLILCTVLFAVLTAATPLARSLTEISVLRFIGGLGLGGAMPCFLTLVSEYAPKARRALAMGMLWCGYPLGGVLGGLIGSQLALHDHWPVIFYLGGALALVVAVLQWLFLPESLQFLALKRGMDHEIRKIALRLAPDRDFSDAHFVADAPSGERAKLKEVFADGLLIPTILLWVPLFMTFSVTTFTVLWMPGLLESAGTPIATTALMLALANFATLPSQVAAGYVLDKVGAFRVLPLTYGAVAIAFAVLATWLDVIPVVAVVVVTIGFLQGPGIAGMLYLATSIYPSQVRSTGVGFAMGIGRSGQVAASLIIGWLVAQGTSVRWTFLTMVAPPAIALVCVALLGLALRARQAQRGEVGATTKARS